MDGNNSLSNYTTFQGWRTSVKRRVFIMALHDYFEDRYAIALFKSRATENAIRNGTITTTPVTTADSVDPVQRPDSPDPDEYDIPVSSDQSIMRDKDYLQYLTMRHLPALADALDDDGSGFIRISEVNEFTQGKPQGWTLLQWIAYWARGWACESAQYSHLIFSLYSGMRDRLGDALVENVSMVFGYLKSPWAYTVKYLACRGSSISKLRTDTPLDDLVRQHMKMVEDRLEASLENFFYTLDSPESVALIFETVRLEKVRLLEHLPFRLMISPLSARIYTLYSSSCCEDMSA